MARKSVSFFFRLKERKSSRVNCMPHTTGLLRRAVLSLGRQLDFPLRSVVRLYTQKEMGGGLAAWVGKARIWGPRIQVLEADSNTRIRVEVTNL